jgi:tRNA nucleotidyltransferase (CCA-adding enzyme)
MNLTALSPENYPFDLDLLPQSAYLVGGAVRDGILGRKREYLDLDFVMPGDAVGVARKIAKRYQAGFVLLDGERNIARVVFPQGTVDIARQEGDDLETDLHRRDFTVNAIAYNPRTQEIVDPLHGCADIQAGILRMVSPANLEDDPLRLLRGYRQAAQLDFEIDGDTQKTIRELAPLLGNVAAERFRSELSYLLASSTGTKWIIQAAEDGLLKCFFKSITVEKCVQRSGSLRDRLLKVDLVMTQVTTIWQQLEVELRKYIRDTIKTTWLGIAKLAFLVNNQPELAEIELAELTYSRAEIKAITTTLRLSRQLKNLPLSLRQQYFFFQEAEAIFLAIAIYSLASNTSIDQIEPLIARYLNPDDLAAHPTALLSGKEIILALNIAPSPLIGELLTEIAVAQVEGRISTKNEAIELTREIINS